MRLPRSVEQVDVGGKRVLVRADLNVPLEAGEVADDTRIRAALPTLRHLVEHGAAEVAVCSHLGRPKTEDDRKRFSMTPVAARLSELLDDERLRVLENTRFDPRETKNDAGFARELADGMDLYVNDAFGSAHRAHASTEAVAHLLPAYAGLLLLAELRHLARLLGEVERPFVLVAGGAKVADKLGVLAQLGGRADTVLVGGKMAEELRDDNPLPFQVELPTDVVAAAAFEADAESLIVVYDALPDGWLGLDVGPETRDRFGELVRAARTVFWNGPMGVFEWPRFAAGTRPSRRRLRTRVRPGPTRSWAAATRCALSLSSGSPSRSPGCRRAAAPHSSCWRARSYPEWPSSRTPEEGGLRHGVHLPGARYALQHMLAPLGEVQTRPRDEILHRLREEDLGTVASDVTRAPIETARPPTLPSIVRHSPVWRPARTSIPSPVSWSTIACAQRILRAGPSNAAKKPSPAVSSSRPR